MLCFLRCLDYYFYIAIFYNFNISFIFLAFLLITTSQWNFYEYNFKRIAGTAVNDFLCLNGNGVVMECDITSKTSSSLLFSRLRCLKSNRTEIKPGSICDEQFELLVELSPVYSKKSIQAMRDYLVLGKKRKEVCEQHKVSNGYLSISLGKIYYTHNLVRYLIQFYNN